MAFWHRLRQACGGVTRCRLAASLLICWTPMLTTELRVAFGADAPIKQRSRNNPEKEASDSAGKENNSRTDRLIADGVGQTADQALKNAFRNAVRQVVGAVVDAETLVENDQVVDDKVLTYSDGFVKKYDEIPGSKKMLDGLHHVTIIATVERRSVIAKLKAANVVTKDVDGKGLFAEIVTKSALEKDLASIIKSHFEGFPVSCLDAKVLGSPTVVDKDNEKATLQVTVVVTPNVKAYSAFVGRLQPVLRKMATSIGRFSVRFQPTKYGYYVPATAELSDNNLTRLVPLWAPKIFAELPEPTGFPLKRQGEIAIALCTSGNSNDKTTWTYYTLDSAASPPLLTAVNQIIKARLLFADIDGTALVKDDFVLAVDEKESHPFGFSTTEKDRLGSGLIAAVGRSQSDRQTLRVIPPNRQAKVTPTIYLVAPQLLGHSPVSNGSFAFQSSATIIRRVTLPLKDIQAIASVSCELSMSERKPQP